MDVNVAMDRLLRGERALKEKSRTLAKRERYARGDHDLPYAPEGINEEYDDLRKQAPANYIGIAMTAPVQRLRADGIRTGLGDDADKRIWKAWQSNKMDQRQDLAYASMLKHGRGLVSVWPNVDDKSKPIIRPESLELVHVEMDPDDAFTPLWAVKVYTVQESSPLTQVMWLPSSVMATKTIGIVYDKTSMMRFERGGYSASAGWEYVTEGTHPMRRVPFALYDFQVDAMGQPWSSMDALIPQQDAINTIRFNTLLAMQFSAFRQRVVTGFDPRATDKDGNFLYQKNEDGTPKVDAQGRAIPLLNTPGRVGVDRLLAFPGGDTKVFDLAESNLKNYIEVLSSFLVQFFSTAQIPPQYLLSQMANLSGDALAGAESTLASLVKELQLAAGEGNESLAELAWYAMGETTDFTPEAETVWADAEARSFAQIVDAIVKLISTGFPRRGAFEMIPGATSSKVNRWLEMAEDEAFANRLQAAARAFEDVTPPEPVNDQTEITDDAPTVGS